MIKYFLVAFLVFSASICMAAPEDAKFASFERDVDMPFVSAGGAVVSRVEKNAADGRFSLMLSIKGSPTDSWPGLSFSPTNDADWFAYHALKMDVFVEGTKPVTLGARLDTKGGNEFLYSLPALQPGWNRNWTIPINDVRETVDLHRVTSLWLGASAPREDATVYIDNVRLGPFEFGFKKVVHLEIYPGIKPNKDETKRGFMAFSSSYSSLVFPNSKPKSRISSASLFLAQGEKEPLVFNIHALKDLNNISASVSTFIGPKNAQIKPADWDIRVVRHRDKREFYGIDSYITDVPTYISIPGATEKLNTGKTATFWLTLTAPVNARPGVYKGSISLASGASIQKIPVSVRILPFKLPELIGDLHGMYYYPSGKGLTTKEQIRFDMADMRVHGMTSMGLCSGVDAPSYKVEGETVKFDFKGDTAFEFIMDAYRDMGFKEAIVMLADTGQTAAAVHPYASESYAKTYTSFWTGLDKICKAKGWKPMYIQPDDEVGWRTDADRERNTYLLGLLKKAGLMTEVDGPSDNYFNNVAGPLSDIWNYNGILAPPDIIEKAQRSGKLVVYYNFECGGWTPEAHRWGRGLFNWKHNLRGSFNWTYRGGSGSYFDDQDAKIADFVHYYPPHEGDPGGPSTGWEGSREGIDDRKYIRLLESLIKAAPGYGKRAASEAKRISANLKQIKAQLTNHPDGRADIIVWEKKIQPADALKLGYIKKIDPDVAWYYAGELKLPNNLPIAASDDIRWVVASSSVKLLNLMGKAAPLPGDTSFEPVAVNERLVSIRKTGRTGASGVSRPVTKLPVLKTAPILDGEADNDPGWKDAAAVNLTLSNGTGMPTGPTKVKFGIYGSILYVCFICSEDRPDDIVARIRNQGGSVSEDDCVEVFIDPKRSEKTYYQVLANSLGTTQQIGPGGSDWKSDVRAAGKVEKANRRWICELAIPVDELKMGPSIGLNFARERRPINVFELQSWAVTGGSFGKADMFGIATLSGKMQKGVIQQVKPELNVRFDSPIMSINNRYAHVVFEPVMNDTDFANANITLQLKGQNKSFQFTIKPPLKDRMQATIDVGDLPSGDYSVNATLQLSGKALAKWKGTLLRISR